MKEKSRQKRLRLLAEAKKKPAVFTVYVVLRLIVVAILVSSILRGEYLIKPKSFISTIG